MHEKYGLNVFFLNVDCIIAFKELNIPSLTKPACLPVTAYPYPEHCVTALNDASTLGSAALFNCNDTCLF